VYEAYKRGKRRGFAEPSPAFRAIYHYKWCYLLFLLFIKKYIWHFFFLLLNTKCSMYYPAMTAFTDQYSLPRWHNTHTDNQAWQNTRRDIHHKPTCRSSQLIYFCIYLVSQTYITNAHMWNTTHLHVDTHIHKYTNNYTKHSV
jgi:hypothetical protein